MRISLGVKLKQILITKKNRNVRNVQLYLKNATTIMELKEMEDGFMIKEKSLELKSKDLSNLIYFDAEKIDKGMWEILYELNKKGWRTTFCC